MIALSESPAADTSNLDRSEPVGSPVDARERRLSANELARLGPVLCVFRADDPHPLAGWQCARRTAHCVAIDSEGPVESLLFLDAHGAACWQLCRLPDSDFLGWDNLVGALSARQAPRSIARTLSCRAESIEWQISLPLWRACPLRLHRVASVGGDEQLAATCVSLSPTGRREALRWSQRLLPSIDRLTDGDRWSGLPDQPSASR